MGNYWKLKRFSLLYYCYAYVDSTENLADQLFILHKVQVSFGKEFIKDGLRYKVIFCKVRKKDETLFLTALAELDNKLLLLGYTDYDEFCEEMRTQIGN